MLRGCNFAERDAIFQFLNCPGKACQPSELRYFRVKKILKVAFTIKQLYRILGPEKSRRLTVLIIFAFSIMWACGLIKVWDSFDAAESTRQAST